MTMSVSVVRSFRYTYAHVSLLLGYSMSQQIHMYNLHFFYTRKFSLMLCHGTLMYIVVESCLPCLNFYIYKAIENKIPILVE